MNKQVIIITAHPDDHLVSGGTLALLSRQGYKIHEILFTNGERAKLLTNPKANKKTVTQTRLTEFKKAHKLIGIESYECLNLTNGDIQSSPEIVNKIIRSIRTLQPEIVILLHPNDYHPDHIASSQIGIEAIKVSNISTMSELGKAYRVPIVLLAEGLIPIQPDIVIDISNFWDIRTEAERIYESQMTPRMKQWGECFAGKNGYALRAQYGEAFEILKNWPADVSKLLNI